MTDVLSLFLSYPTVALTIPFALVLLYWLFVVLGALDIDAFHGADAASAGAKGALEGATKGVLEGATKGVLEGATKGALEGATKGVIEGATKGVIEGAAKAGLEGASHALANGVANGHAAGASQAADGPLVAVESGRDEGTGTSTREALRVVPATVTLSVWILLAWLFCTVGTQAVGGAGGAWRWLLDTGVLAGSLLLAVAPTGWAIRPLGRLFRTRHAKGHQDLVGRICLATTGRVDERFGQAALDDGSLSLLVQVRRDGGEPIRKGERLLLVAWDPERQAFLAEPYEPLLADAEAPSADERAALSADAEPAEEPAAPRHHGTP